MSDLNMSLLYDWEKWLVDRLGEIDAALAARDNKIKAMLLSSKSRDEGNILHHLSETKLENKADFEAAIGAWIREGDGLETVRALMRG